MSCFFKPEMANNYLVLIGGNEDKRHDKKILKSCLALRPVTKVAVVPTASSIPSDMGDDYRNAFRELGIDHTRIIDVRYAEEANREEFLNDVEEADLLFFTGGDQTKLVEVLHDTPLLEKIMNRWHQGMVIAGTSAGAAAAGNYTLYDGDDIAFQKGSVKITNSFGFLPGVFIDTHFDVRKRLPRLIQALSNSKIKCGIGLSEDTGIVMRSVDSFEVIGNSEVYVVRMLENTDSNIMHLEENAKWSVNNVNISILHEGDRYNLSTHKLCFANKK